VSTLSVATVVVSHGAVDYLATTLKALSLQTHSIEQVVVVETSADPACSELAKQFGFSVVEPGDIKLGAAIESGVQSLKAVPGWLWILHDDSAPEPTALQMLASAAELSPSVAIVGPKLLEWGNEIRIQQLGITVTPTGKPFLLVENQYDQGQHDDSRDTLAVSTAGMLVAGGLWQKLGGLNDTAPVFAQDIEFCAQARVAGFRVVVEPRARVLHAGLSMQQARTRKWLGGSRTQALSKAHVHLAGILAPAMLLPLMYLALPLVALISIPQNLITKKPSRIFGQFAAWLWAWFTVGSRLRARKRVRGVGKIRPLRDFLATRAQRKKRREAKFEYVIEAQESTAKGLFASGSVWLGLVPLIFGWSLLPVGAIYAGRLVPIGDSFGSIWSATALANVPYLSGIDLPTDPFNWVLSVFGLTLSSNPSLALAIFVFVAPSIGFAGFWVLTSLFIARVWVRNLVGLVFALSPQVLMVQAMAGVADLVTISVAPWLTFVLIKAATSYNSSRAWRWVGLAGLLAALIAVSNPIIFVLFVIFGIALGVNNIRKLPILSWFALPGAVLIYPWVLLAIEQNQFALLTVTGSAFLLPAGLYESVTALIFLGVAGIGAVASLFGARLAVSVSSWVVAIILGVGSVYQPIAGSFALQALSLAALLVGAGLFLDGLKRKWAITAVSIAASAGAVASGLVLGPLAPSQVSFGSQRQAPALVVAAAEVDEGIRTLRIDANGNQLDVELLWGAGRSLEQTSLAYQLLLPASPIANELAQLSGSLVAGNPSGVQELLSSLGIDFVLLQGDNQESISAARVAIDSMTILQAAGQTPYGHLWQVVGSANNTPSSLESPSNKNLQLGILAAFLLLAIPTPASIRGAKRLGKQK
jgi:GT2 family glycosyltransferase/uncharacterized membrane protein